MNYSESLAYLDELYGMLGYDLGLGRIISLMDSMDNVQDKMKFIHVAGTNGKGSICSMTSKILQEAGYKVGVYTSPHLEKYNERMVINGEEITDDDFASYLSYVKDKCEEIKSNGVGQPTVFEVVTAAAFKYFYDKTFIIISHRRENIDLYDRVIKIEHGNVKEMEERLRKWNI